VGGSLALAAHDVTFLARPPAAARLTAAGLRLIEAATGAERAVPDVHAVNSLPTALAGPAYDALILAVKAYAVAPFIQELSAAMAVPPPILALQNGVAAEDQLAAAFGPGAVIAGSVTTAVSQQPDGAIVIEKARGLGLALGHPLSQPLAVALARAGLRVRLYPAVGPLKWSKLLTNLTGNATSAILDLPVAALFSDPRLYAIEIATLRECLRVMQGLHYPVVDLPGVPARLLAWAVTRLPAPLARPILRRALGGARGAKRPSLNIAVRSGQSQTEVRWLNGAVVDHGRRLGVPTPVNRVLTDTVEGLTTGRLRREDFAGQPAALLNLLPSF
jgi:2-dehydropantoate 2-reductase